MGCNAHAAPGALCPRARARMPMASHEFAHKASEQAHLECLAAQHIHGPPLLGARRPTIQAQVGGGVLAVVKLPCCCVKCIPAPASERAQARQRAHVGVDGGALAHDELRLIARHLLEDHERAGRQRRGAPARRRRRRQARVDRRDVDAHLRPPPARPPLALARWCFANLARSHHTQRARRTRDAVTACTAAAG